MRIAHSIAPAMKYPSGTIAEACGNPRELAKGEDRIFLAGVRRAELVSIMKKHTADFLFACRKPCPPFCDPRD
jgi:hypothetical protein